MKQTTLSHIKRSKCCCVFIQGLKNMGFLHLLENLDLLPYYIWIYAINAESVLKTNIESLLSY